MIIRSITLSFTDLTGSKTGCTTLGSNKFWRGWVVDHGNGIGDFCCQWGSTGTAGSTNGSKHGISLDAAIRLFDAKSGSKIRKGYTELQVRDDAEEAAKQAAKGIVPVTAPAVTAAPTGRTFHPEVSRLLATIYDSTSFVVRAGLSAQAGATEDNPIGNLSDAQLDLGGGILDEIADFLRQEGVTGSQTLPLGSSGVPHSRIIDLTNQFMSNVPRAIDRKDRGRANLHKLVISSEERLEEQRKFLQLLRDAHLSAAVFTAAAAQTSTGGKEAVWYDGLQCDIDHLDPTSSEFRRVVELFTTGQSQKNNNWFRNGRSTLKVARVFKFTRNGTEAAFRQYADQVTRKPGAVGLIMAWHGTRTPHILGISKSGLLMPENLPRGVHISGKAFGRGIYHAPCWPATGTKEVGGYPTDGTNGALKSMNYTGMSGAVYGSGSSKTAYMYLQDVALGLADGYTTACWDKHRPNNYPRNDFIFACGLKSQGGFVHDELVTFDQSAQTFRYLVEIAAV